MKRANREIKTKGMLAGLGNEDKKFIFSKKLKIQKQTPTIFEYLHPVYLQDSLPDG